MMRTLIATAFILTGLALLSPAPVRAYTQAEQQACQNDAFRLCGDAIPDERRVRACMVAKMRHLSVPCRRMFQRRR
jgi:hypothetical protein